MGNISSDVCDITSADALAEKPNEIGVAQCGWRYFFRVLQGGIISGAKDLMRQSVQSPGRIVLIVEDNR